MKKILLIITRLFIATCLLVALHACDDKVNLPPQSAADYIQLYMPQATDGLVHKTLSMDADAQYVLYGAYYGGEGVPNADIPVQFTVNQTVVDSMNTANGTQYALLPQTCYQLEAVNALIKMGERSTPPLKISFSTLGADAPESDKEYMLPISLETKAAIKINPELKTTIFVIKFE